MPSARSVIRLGVALLIAGAAFDLPALYVPGIALALVAGGAFAWVELGARGIRIERVPGPATVVEGEPYPLRLRIRRGKVTPPGGELRDPLLEQPLELQGRPPRHLTVDTSFPRRGRRELGAATLEIRDPMRLHSREVRSGPGGEVLVLPRIEPVEVTAGGGAGQGTIDGFDRGAAAGSRLDLASLDVEIDGVRPYRPGTPASRIHWPSVARTGSLFERRLVAGAGSSPVVALDARAPADADSLDRAVRAAASLCLHLARRIGCTALIPGAARPLEIDRQLSGWAQAHAQFALVEAGAAPPALVRPTRAGVFLVIADAPGSRAGRARALLPGASYLVSPVAMAGVAPSFTVAGCEGRRLGSRLARRVRPEVPAA
jgi:uncharacterized protein (DUF58 family)